MSNPATDFDADFKILTGHMPFPWQQRLYHQWFTSKPIGQNIPHAADLPTGLGKTSVIGVWLLALMRHPERMPRRLVYVVNRRTVVDQTTSEVTRYRQAAASLEEGDPLRVFVERLGLSTLRGQFADNQEWSADPSRPAVICGTVDMIGSRLLFGGYRVGFKSRPLHAGFLGQDALLVHDEAHLEPAFQELIEEIEREQARERERAAALPWPQLRVMALSATSRRATTQTNGNEGEALELTSEEKEPPDVIPTLPTEPTHHVWRRLRAKKSLRLHGVADAKKLPEVVAELTLKHQASGAPVLVFVRTIDGLNKVFHKLTSEKTGVPPDHVTQLTGTMRGYERDKLIQDTTFQRFLPGTSEANTTSTVYLLCTSAGEVGVNLSAAHMVCDLSTFDSMAQRLGRVNRFGDREDTQVDVIHPESFDEKDPLTPALKRTLGLLKKLDGDASPHALLKLRTEERLDAFAPSPIIRPATDMLFDAWTMTTIRERMPARPPVAPYLHGVAEWEPPRTSVAWRDEVEVIRDDLMERHGEDFPQQLLDDYPLKPHELLSDQTERVYAVLNALIAEPKARVKRDERRRQLERAHRNAAANVWLIDDGDTITVTTVRDLVSGKKKLVVNRLAGRTVLLPPSVGGLSDGFLDPASETADDVADQWLDQDGRPRRARVWDDDSPPGYEQDLAMAVIRSIDTDPFADELGPPDEAGEDVEEESVPGVAEWSTRRRFWHWYIRPREAEEVTRASARPIMWDHHTRDVVKEVRRMVGALNLPGDLQRVLIVAAELHDLGKKRQVWQRSIGNPDPTEWYAKPGKPVGGPRWRPRHLSDYRHEFGSLLDVLDGNDASTSTTGGLCDEMRDLLLHLIAAHHGYGRPHFPPEAYDHERYGTARNDEAASGVIRRYARLQRRFGRWGLAYIESLLRAADWAASANPSEIDPASGGRR